MEKQHAYRTFVDPLSHGRFEGYVVELTMHEGGRLGVLGRRFDVGEPFTNPAEAKRAAERLIPDIQAGEASVNYGLMEQKINGYRISAWAVFDVHAKEWQPALRIKKVEMPGKGEIQDFSDIGPFAQNRRPQREAAAKFAMAYAERLVLGAIPGLRI